MIVEVESIHGGLGQQRMIFYRCQDSAGEWHSYGPVVTTDDAFDVEGFKVAVAAKMAEALAEAEFQQVIA